jgi:hypothetical protein
MPEQEIGLVLWCADHRAVPQASDLTDVLRLIRTDLSVSGSSLLPAMPPLSVPCWGADLAFCNFYAVAEGRV